MGVRHWPDCNGNHPPGTGCNGPHGDRMKEQMAADQAAAMTRENGPQLVRRYQQGVTVVYLAEETIPAGAQAEVNPLTGMLRVRRT